MKIKKVEAICKSDKRIFLCEGDGVQWIGNGMAMYPLHNMPVLDETNVFTLFDVAEKDRFCSGNYMPISSVSEFATFPEASFPWTEYLLEQYVASFSEKFYLLHGNYNKNCAVGAIVRKTSRFNSFDDLVTNVLARSDVPLRKKDGLNYLAANGYIARRSYTNIEALIIDARAMRNQKEK